MSKEEMLESAINDSIKEQNLQQVNAEGDYLMNKEQMMYLARLSFAWGHAEVSEVLRNTCGCKTMRESDGLHKYRSPYNELRDPQKFDSSRINSLTEKEAASNIVSMFDTVQDAKNFSVLWQDEYVDDEDKEFRKRVKLQIDKICR